MTGSDTKGFMMSEITNRDTDHESSEHQGIAENSLYYIIGEETGLHWPESGMD